jgi:hypothetical protein
MAGDGLAWHLDVDRLIAEPIFFQSCIELFCFHGDILSVVLFICVL